MLGIHTVCISVYISLPLIHCLSLHHLEIYLIYLLKSTQFCLLVLTASLGVKKYSVKQTKAKQKWKIICLGNPLSKSENVLLLLSGILFYDDFSLAARAEYP